MCGYTHATVCMWRSEDNLWGSVLSFHHVGSGDWTQTARLAGKLLYPQSQLDHPGRFEFLLAHFLGWAKCNIYLCANEAHFIRNWMDMGAICSAFTKSSNFSSHRGICPLEHKWHFSMNQISEYQSTECKVSLWGFSTLELICYNYASARRG